jgi:hypothetical protein
MFAPGTAPKESTFYPNASNEFPPLSNYANDSEVNPDATRTDALDSFGGDTVQATSATVDTGLGRPISGQTSHEIRHDGKHSRKHERHGLEGTGASVDTISGKQHQAVQRD